MVKTMTVFPPDFFFSEPGIANWSLNAISTIFFEVNSIIKK